MTNHAKIKPALVLYPIAEVFNALKSEIEELGIAASERNLQAMKLVGEWQSQGIRLVKTKIEISQNPLAEDSQNTTITEQVINKKLQPEIMYDIL